MLNRPCTIYNEAIDRLPEVPVEETMDDILTLEEIQKAIHLSSSGKAQISFQLKSAKAWPSANAKETAKPMSTTEEFPCYPSQVRS